MSTSSNITLFQLNFPPTLTDERATDYHRKDFKALISFLEEQTGKNWIKTNSR
jgi:benzoyl-CoA reductase/2-hydroxyglutaryl-CoA dehydratase subunit BcrC/BadD/HgdB